MKEKPISFETERLFITPTSVDDASFMLELLNSPTWLKYIGDRNVYNLKDAKEYIKSKITPQLVKHGFSNYTITRKSDKTKVGAVGLYDRPGLEGIDIGFALLPEYERKGYAHEAATKIMDAAHNVFNIKIVKAITTKENISSQKLLEKLGLRYVDTIRIPNDDEDLLLYMAP